MKWWRRILGVQSILDCYTPRLARVWETVRAESGIVGHGEDGRAGMHVPLSRAGFPVHDPDAVKSSK